MLFGGFLWYSRRLVAKRFHAMRILKGSEPVVCDDTSVLVFGNHPGWWDPIVAVVVNDVYFQPRTCYAPIDAVAVKRYPVMEKVGFFPVEQDSVQGAREFLRTMTTLLDDPQATVVLTPEGRFVDVRNSVPFQPGLAHVVSKAERTSVIPMAIEYTFWNESTPELLFAFGPSIAIDEHRDTSRTKESWNAELEAALKATQQKLREAAITRDPKKFHAIIRGRTGFGGVYDFARRCKAAVLGKPFQPSHEPTHVANERGLT